MSDSQNIRNFSIIAHIDHGKSTLADRFLEITKAVPKREMKEQFLDRMDLERERGITIKAQSIRLKYHSQDGSDYTFNLIDTPGHVDFTYEVSRSLAACEGALLVIDAAQGVEAQTVANVHLAQENKLEIIPVINKIDLKNADPDRAKKEIEESLGLNSKKALLVSAKTGEGVEEVLEAIVKEISPPSGGKEDKLKALIFDSFYDSYRGVVAYIKVVSGVIAKGQRVTMMATGKSYEVEEIGIFAPDMTPIESLSEGEVGYLIAGIKKIEQARVGDTITSKDNPAEEPLTGYREAKPMVFSGLYPVDGGQFENLREGLAKLKLNDPALTYDPETSQALGFGFRCGFLGLLHMEIVEERLEREFEIELIATAPSVAYQVTKTNNQSLILSNPNDFPDKTKTEMIEEPYIRGVVLSPSDYVGQIMELCQNSRGEFVDMQYLGEKRVQIEYLLPLSEIMLEFYDQLKSRTRGYASFDYEHIGHRKSDLVKLDILLAGDPIDAFSSIVHKDKAYHRGRELVQKLRKIIPRQYFDIPIQASIGKRIIARETVKAKKKDVLAKCYGGDVTRKRKLLQKQKAGQKKLKQIGKVQIPQEAFIKVLKVEGEK